MPLNKISSNTGMIKAATKINSNSAEKLCASKLNTWWHTFWKGKFKPNWKEKSRTNINGSMYSFVKPKWRLALIFLFLLIYQAIRIIAKYETNKAFIIGKPQITLLTSFSLTKIEIAIGDPMKNPIRIRKTVWIFVFGKNFFCLLLWILFFLFIVLSY